MIKMYILKIKIPKNLKLIVKKIDKYVNIKN
jgi:hypothetical protein